MSKVKQEHIEYWVKLAEDDLETAEYLMKGKRYLHALFWCHLLVEKICKALWIKNNQENVPPKIHNLLRILDLAEIIYDGEQEDLLGLLNKFQLEGRYTTEITKINSSLTEIFAENLFSETKKIRLWLLQKLK